MLVGSLAAAALALGFAGSAHCAVMCGAPCAAVTRGEPARARGFHAGRLVAYMAAGALAAAAVGALAAWRESFAVLRPVWAMLHTGVLAFGLWLLATGRQPAWRSLRAPALVAGASAGWAAVRGPLRTRGPGSAVALGLAWVAWPCGLLHSALLLAALADTPAGGAAVMAAFALGTLPALAAAPVLLRRLGASAWGVRVAGATLAAAAGWSLGRGVWPAVAAWCGLA